MFWNRKKPDNDSLRQLKENVSYYSIRFRMICGGAKLKGKNIPRIYRAIFLQSESQVRSILDNAPDLSGKIDWFSIILAYGYLRTAFSRVELLATLEPAEQGAAIVPDEIMQEYRRLKNEKSNRYKRQRQHYNDRKGIYLQCKKKGMKDADAYREIIKMEEPNLKPGTASYIAAMNRLKVWRNRHKEELQHID